MPPQNNPDRIRILFDDHRLVANAGLLLPATLARHLGLRELVDHHLDLGGAPGRANTGDKMLTLVASALAGGDCIDDADALRAGGTVGVLGCVVKAPSTLGTFLRSFRWGHVRQLDRVSRQLLARAWAAGAGPGDSPLTIDLDSTICETYGLAKEGARHHGYTGARGYHPLLAIAAGTGEVLMSRLREGRANTARGAAHFLRETVGRVRYGGARGQLTVRADSGFYAHTVVAACREMDVRFSITIRQRASLRDLIEAIPEEDWTPIPYWMDGAADVAETTYTPFQTKPDAPPARLIVRRVKPTPGSQLALFASYLHHRRWGDAGTGGLITPRSRRALGLGALITITFVPMVLIGGDPDASPVAETMVMKMLIILWVGHAVGAGAQGIWELDERALGFYSAVVTAGSVVALIFFATTLFDAYGNAVAIGLSAVALVLSIVAGMLFFFYAVPFNILRPVAGWFTLVGSVTVLAVGLALVTTAIRAA